ncbi:MAG TPA: hypothetical protein VJU84_09665 [Pyrinomonadaceae bacterium]|nr:hypothetical protein [Pyrinomonadaceae bacterium]
MELAPITQRRHAGVYEKLSGPFKPRSRIRFELVGTNNSILPLEVRRWDTLAQNKPRLFRDNQEVSYRRDIIDLLKDKHLGDSEMVRLDVIRLAPGERKVLEYFNLNDWYEPLGPGHYELSTQHRFIQGGKWVNSAAIVFEVEEKPRQ